MGRCYGNSVFPFNLLSNHNCRWPSDLGGGKSVLRFVLSPEVKVENPSPIPHTSILDHKLRDLATTERVVTQFFSDGKLSDEIYQQLMKRIQAERASLVTPRSAAPKKEPVPPSRPIVTPPPPQPPREAPPSVVTPPYTASDDEVIIKPVPSFINKEEPEPEPVYERPVPPPPPRRSFSEVLNSFMEESNIRWGEIIGGLLIIGCSTALVVSLWAQISQIPVLKFLIFTTVTAVLFGIGLYTEHRWKLPTTSRGILTIATLLVPLNFLAIAAVSASNTSGALVIGSELIAPAIFLCLVYFAGRIITPGCAHILSAGVLGSSVGQLLVRHFASPDGPLRASDFSRRVSGLVLRRNRRTRAPSSFSTIAKLTKAKPQRSSQSSGAMSFAALLPLGLLLYKSGPLGMSMMYLAPIVTLWGLPMVATGDDLVETDRKQRTGCIENHGHSAGNTWTDDCARRNGPGVAQSIQHCASGIAQLCNLHGACGSTRNTNRSSVRGHLFCFGLPRHVPRVCRQHHLGKSARHVSARIEPFSQQWAGTRRRVCTFPRSFGMAVAPKERTRQLLLLHYCLPGRDSEFDASRHTSASGRRSITRFGFVYGLYSLGAFWIAWRRRLVPFAWIGSALLLFSLAHNFAQSLAFSFPWQTALFAHATICAVAAIVSSRYK